MKKEEEEKKYFSLTFKITTFTIMQNYYNIFPKNDETEKVSRFFAHVFHSK